MKTTGGTEALSAETTGYVIATFYKFVHLPEPEKMREELLKECQSRQIIGTILLAEEGINATIAGSPAAVDAVLAALRSDPRLSDFEVKISRSKERPFRRLKVKIKPEIVTMGVAGIDPARQTGTYLSPAEWNRLIGDPDVLLIDTRNEYEVQVGTFKGAQNPHTRSFREFPEFVRQHLEPHRQRKIAMFCTGGIRCEKATAYLRKKGFSEVYHLHGGILKYLENVPPEESLWEGECFVFDERVAVDHRLKPGTHGLCRKCGQPVRRNASPENREICQTCCQKDPER